MIVSLKLVLDVQDEDAVIKAGDRAINDGWGYESVRQYLRESADFTTPPAAQALYEIISAGLWTALAAEDGPVTGVCEIVDNDLSWEEGAH